MKHYCLAITLAVAALFAPAAMAGDDDIEEDNGVLVLTEKNFDKAVETHEMILVEFYAPWCGHCKKLAPEYEKAAKTLNDKDSSVKLAKVDATVHKDLASKFKVGGYPTLKFFKGGKPTDYSGPREAKGIVSWLEKKTGPPAKEIKKADEITAAKDENGIAVVGFFKKQDSDEAKVYLKVASDFEGVPFLITSDESLMKSEKAKDGSIVLYKNFDEEKVVYDGKSKEKDIETWINGESMPLVNEFTQEAAPKIFGSAVKVHFLQFFSFEDEEAKKKNVETLRAVAKDHKGKMIFVYLDSEFDGNEQILEFFGLSADDAPCNLIYEMEGNGKFIGDKKKTPNKDEIGKFVTKYFKKELKKDLKTQDIPEDWDKEPVKVLVGKNFKDVALDKSKDVFVEFYAPWCGHCKALAPVWDQLGKEFEDDKSVVIAKMDSTANEVDEVQVQGFPTLKMFKKDTNKIVDYSGGRDFDSLVHFVKTGEILKDPPKKEKDDKKDEKKDDKKKDKKDEL